MMRPLLVSVILASFLAMGCGNSADTSTDTKVPPAPKAAEGTAPVYDNDPSKDGVGANGMPGGGPTGK